MTDIFNMREASIFARALAGGEGISVEESSAAITPVSRKDGTIVMGEPSIYNADEYMGNLHKEISKQMQDMRFFFEVEEGDDFTDAASSILQDVRVEFHKHGEYQGRDSILAKHYADNCRKNGGISEVIKKVEESSPTLAAMVAIGNELRNDWQGYQYAEVSPAVQEEMDRLSFLKDEWLELDSKESLETLIERIRYEQNDDGQQGKGSEGDGDSDGGGGESGGSEQNSEEGNGDSSGEDRGGEGQDTDNNPESGTDKGESGTEGEESGTDEDSGSVQGRELSDESGDTEGQGGDDKGESGTESSESEDEDSESGTEWGGHGDTEASISLEEMGFLKKPIENNEAPPENDDIPYVSQGDKDLQEEVIKENLQYKSGLYYRIEKEIGSFTLSKKMKKYFIAQKQSGYQYGLKRGKLCSKNMYRVSVGGAEPTIFKKKNASKIEQDTAIFILGDCSGSMYGAPYVTSAACQISMSEVLQSMKIPHMMMQFSTTGIYTRSHYIMRSFSESRVSREILLSRYSSGDIQMGCNADGEAVIAASQYLIKMPQRKKLIIVLSDGDPAYSSGSSKFLKDVVEKIEGSKCMDIVGVGIDTEVSRYYSNSKKVTELKDLENVLLSILKDTIIK